MVWLVGCDVKFGVFTKDFPLSRTVHQGVWGGYGLHAVMLSCRRGSGEGGNMTNVMNMMVPHGSHILKSYCWLRMTPGFAVHDAHRDTSGSVRRQCSAHPPHHHRPPHPAHPLSPLVSSCEACWVDCPVKAKPHSLWAQSHLSYLGPPDPHVMSE